MDKIDKVLAKLSQKEKEIVRDILDRLGKNNVLGLNIQKLKDHKEIFRVRKEDIRVVYQKTETQKIFILAIERRSEKTYRRF